MTPIPDYRRVGMSVKTPAIKKRREVIGAIGLSGCFCCVLMPVSVYRDQLSLHKPSFLKST